MAIRRAPWELLLALAPVTGLALFWRAWQQAYAFDNGLDATEPGFATYWLSLFGFNVVVLPLMVTAWYAWIYLSSRRLPARPTPAEELRRIWILWLHTVAVAVAAYWGGSYFAEQDAAWHQVTMRDTAFTPSHVALFYGAFPLILYAATGAYLYARTRLPDMFGGAGASVGRRFPLPFLLVIGGALLLLFQVAFNEFGHTFWEAEEIFSAPLHWPFVVFAYLLGGVLAIWFQTLPRVVALSAAADQQTLSAAAAQPTQPPADAEEKRREEVAA
jgi:methane/ammonia monooxygenase subunit C